MSRVTSSRNKKPAASVPVPVPAPASASTNPAPALTPEEEKRAQDELLKMDDSAELLLDYDLDITPDATPEPERLNWLDSAESLMEYMDRLFNGGKLQKPRSDTELAQQVARHYMIKGEIKTPESLRVALIHVHQKLYSNRLIAAQKK